MGIESDQVVYEYLSRVGDVAQQRQLSSATRMRLVSELRNEIDRCRARAAVDSPAAVRRILDRLGSPDEIVAAVGASGDARARTAHPRQAPPATAVPVQRETGAPEAPDAEERRPKGLRRVVPRPRPARPPASPPPSGAASPPHLATADELGGATARPDWWTADDSPFGIGDDVPGFVGGVEIPDLLKPPPRKDPARQADPARAEAAPVAETDAAAADPESPARRRRLALPTRRTGGWSNPLLLIAAGLLLAGAVLGNWFALLLGWIIAYGSRRLTPAESKWAVMGLPGLALAAGLLWLWGRSNDRWGTPIAQGHMNDAIAQTWPWVVRAAAVLSALFLLWRSQRKRQ
ncbi:hypothetical protein ABZ484_00300 [Streptomyces sp. NPDC006393]|uniref:hypothetical protein n=1 Tax=Streptomyces sp. NPDC006393 TaxID=3156763 RepID=UPI0033C49E8C